MTSQCIVCNKPTKSHVVNSAYVCHSCYEAFDTTKINLSRSVSVFPKVGKRPSEDKRYYNTIIFGRDGKLRSYLIPVPLYPDSQRLL